MRSLGCTLIQKASVLVRRGNESRHTKGGPGEAPGRRQLPTRQGEGPGTDTLVSGVRFSVP